MKLYTPLSHACYFGDSDLMSSLLPITVAHGDGIGLEIMEASLHISKEKVGTKEFGNAVVVGLGKKPHTLKPAQYSSAPLKARKEEKKVLRRFNGEVGYTLSQGQ